MNEAPKVLELRVHGVSGTPPHSTLGVGEGEVERKAGNNLTGFYQAKPGVTTTGPDLPPYAQREAYAWGPLTSGVSGRLGALRRALWLTLLPFALVNVAMWSRRGLSHTEEDNATEEGKAGARARLAGMFVLVAGLLLTALLISTMSGIGVNFLAWQCFRGGVPSCPVLPSWTEFLASDGFNDPGRRLAFGQVVPLLALVGLWLLTRVAIRRYESFTGPSGQDASRKASFSGPILGRDAMWRGEERTFALARLHVTVGLAVVIWSTAWPMDVLVRIGAVNLNGSGLGRAVSDWQLLGVGVFGLLGLAAGLLAAGALVLAYRSLNDLVESATTDREPASRERGKVLVRIAWIVLIAHTALLCWPTGEVSAVEVTGTEVAVAVEDSPTGPVALSGIGAVPAGLVLALFVVVASLFLISRTRWALAVIALPLAFLVMAHAWTSDGTAARVAWIFGILVVCGVVGFFWQRHAGDGAAAWRGAAPAVLVGAAVLIGILFSTGLTLLIADRLNGGPTASALKSEYEQPAVPDVVVLAAGAVLEQGSVEFTEGGVLIGRGLLRSDTLEAADDDMAGEDGAAVRTPLPSGVLEDGQQILVPGGTLRLIDSCVTRLGESQQDPLESAVLQVGDDGGDVEVTAMQTAGTCDGAASEPVRAVATTTAPVLTVPQPYLWFAFALPPLLLIAVATIVFLWFYFGRSKDRMKSSSAKGDPKTVLDRLKKLAKEDFKGSPDRLIEANRARRRATFAHRAEGLVTALILPVLLAGLTITAGTLWDLQSSIEINPVLLSLIDIGLYLSLALALALIGLAARMRTSDGTRRSVGVIWDVSTFWPRAAHPFGPPCYAERVVPELTARARWVLDGAGRVVFSGHSQGSVIVVATLMQLGLKDKDVRDRIRFVSYGSQLRAWFGRIFPDLLGPDPLGHEPTKGRPSFNSAAPDVPDPTAKKLEAPADSLAEWLQVDGKDPHWRSLFRRTDPIGFRVHRDVDCDNPVDVPVMEMPPSRSGDPAPKVETHSNYPASDEYITVVKGWLNSESATAAEPQGFLACLRSALSSWWCRGTGDSHESSKM